MVELIEEYSQNRGLSSNSRNSLTGNSKRNLKKYLNKMEEKPVKMTERSIVVSESQLKLMLDTDENPINTSMNMMLKDINSNFSQASKKLYQIWLIEILGSVSPHKITTGNAQENGRKLIKHTDGEIQQIKHNQTARDNPDLNFDNLNEAFQEFKEEKYGIKRNGQNTVQNKNQKVLDSHGKLTIQHFLNMKKFPNQ